MSERGPENGPPGDGERPESAPPRRFRPPPRRASTESGSGRRTGRGGVLRRITGREAAERAMAERYLPYRYESNAGMIRWLALAFGAWVILMLVVAWIDRSNAGLYQEWKDSGITSIPPTSITTESLRVFAFYEGVSCAWVDGNPNADPACSEELPGEDILAYAESRNLPCPEGATAENCGQVVTFRALLDFAREEGINCNTREEIFTGAAECPRARSIQEDFGRVQDRSNLLLVGFILLFIAVTFPYSGFLHRASRNLLTLKAEGQRFTPEWAVTSHFIPIINLIRPGQAIREMSKGSDPALTTETEPDWKRRGKVPPIAGAWWAIWVLAWVFNPITVPRIFTRTDLSDLISTTKWLMWSDILLAVLGVAAMLLAIEIHRRQEARHAIVGDIEVTPPPPRDPLEEALREGMSRQAMTSDRPDKDRRR